ncbi:MAG: hypothetical protein NTW50_04125 [Candidatus Berkelbacteria bacterium]|nr:hypothetical protein [Candidatus Berkelbacteria bacterium]
MMKSIWIRYVLSALAVAVFGFILLNLLFLLDFGFQSLIDALAQLFTSAAPNTEISWFPPLKHFLFLLVIGLVSWPILRSKISQVYKAIFLVVPTALLLVTIGISFYRWPVVVYSLCTIATVGILYYFYTTKKSWLYYYSVILVALALLIAGLTGTEI